MLFENRGRVISREQILANIWDESGNFVNDNTLTVYIKRLRAKIENDTDNPNIIKTISIIENTLYAFFDIKSPPLANLDV